MRVNIVAPHKGSDSLYGHHQILLVYHQLLTSSRAKQHQGMYLIPKKMAKNDPPSLLLCTLEVHFPPVDSSFVHIMTLQSYKRERERDRDKAVNVVPESSLLFY